MKRLFSILSTLLLVGCSSNSNNNTGDGMVRDQIMREEAMSYGARTALAFYSVRYNTIVEKRATELDQIFNFKRLVLKNNILPPVIRQGGKNLAVDSPNTLRLSDRVIEIVAPARFITAPPTWRDYLVMKVNYPNLPNKRLHPKNPAEYAIWVDFVNKGWFQGKHQAYDIINRQLAHLQSDFAGINLYYELLAQNMISAPSVGKANLGITGNKRKIRLNDQIIRITANSDLQSEKHWDPVVISDNEPHRMNSTDSSSVVSPESATMK
jgi:defect-in-organelle-trafficking protein DotC